MTRRADTMTADYFERLYQEKGDPWQFATSPYERDKYAATLGALPRTRYTFALEVGCSIGVLTQQLAKRCDRLLAVDASPTALKSARERCRDFANVEFAEAVVPQDWPHGVFDLIVLSEVIYYLAADDVAKLAQRTASVLASSADIVLVHWTGETDYPLTGDQAASLFIAQMNEAMEVAESQRKPDYRLDLLKRRKA